MWRIVGYTVSYPTYREIIHILLINIIFYVVSMRRDW